MAVWHFLKSGKGHAWVEGGATISSFDDGLAYVPGEDGFSRDAADQKAKALGVGVTAEYTGTPNWHERIEAEAKAEAEAQKKAVLSATLDAMINPPSQADLINASFDDMLAELPERAKDVETARAGAMATLSEAEAV